MREFSFFYKKNDFNQKTDIALKINEDVNNTKTKGEKYCYLKI